MVKNKQSKCGKCSSGDCIYWSKWPAPHLSRLGQKLVWTARNWRQRWRSQTTNVDIKGKWKPSHYLYNSRSYDCNGKRYVQKFYTIFGTELPTCHAIHTLAVVDSWTLLRSMRRWLSWSVRTPITLRMFAEEHQKVFLQDSVLTLKKKKRKDNCLGLKLMDTYLVIIHSYIREVGMEILTLYYTLAYIVFTTNCVWLWVCFYNRLIHWPTLNKCYAGEIVPIKINS